jgi:circadian clock protein KaiC
MNRTEIEAGERRPAAERAPAPGLAADQAPPDGRADFGIAGLDEITGGGLPRNRMYLVEGDPGAGKTTLALQFLLAGVRRGEPGIYATLSETEEELHDVARSHGWSLDGITVCDLQASEESLKADSEYTLFHPSEIELSETTRVVLDAVERVRPARVVFDSLSEIRLLARDSLRYRRQMLALKQYFSSRNCTVLLLDYEAAQSSQGQGGLQSLTHGVLVLEHLAPEYGGQRRRLRVQKIRGIRFRDGYHDFTIQTGGLEVYPRLVAAEHHNGVRHQAVSSGLAELDELVGGGLEGGTSTMIMGPSGVGKSSLTMQYVLAAVARGETASVYSFDESPVTWLARAESLGMAELRRHFDRGSFKLRQVDPAQLSPGEFAQIVRQGVAGGDRLVVIDSLNGYKNAMPEERFLSLHLHELLAFLGQQGAVTLMVMAQNGLVGPALESPVELSYLADTVLLLRYFESGGEVRHALSVMKKRTGRHEKTVRELRMGPQGLRVGRRLTDFTAVLSGQPVYGGSPAPLLEDEDGGR